jgi:hypothetical protein
MIPTRTTRSARRTAKTVAAGALALTAAVALPAFAIDRGGDGTVDVTSAADAAASTTTTTIDPQVAAWLEQGGAQFLQDRALAGVAAWIESLTPEQRFDILTADLTPVEREAARAWLVEQDRLALQAFLDSLAAQAEAARPAVSTSRASAGGSVWDSLAQCETGGNWAHPTVSGGYSGGLMFYSATWNANGGQAFASIASGATREQQIVVAERVLANSGWGAWPGCSRKLGLR